MRNDRDSFQIVGTMCAAYVCAIVYLAMSTTTAPVWVEMCSLSAEVVKGLPAAFVAIAVSVLAAFIAWRQFKVAHAKLNLDLFEHRYELYNTLWGCLSQFTASSQGKDAREAMRMALQNSAPKFQFLFGEDIYRYVSQVLDQCVAQQAAQLAMHKQQGPAATQATVDVANSTAWFSRQIEELRGRFERYMDFSGWSASGRGRN